MVSHAFWRSDRWFDLWCCLLEWLGKTEKDHEEILSVCTPNRPRFQSETSLVEIWIDSRSTLPFHVCFLRGYCMLIQEFTEFDKLEHNNLSLACNCDISVYVLRFLITSVCHWALSNKTDQSLTCMCVHTTYWFKNEALIFIRVYFPQAVIRKSEFKIKYAICFDLKISHYQENN
jgi:hypothetical protein